MMKKQRSFRKGMLFWLLMTACMAGVLAVICITYPPGTAAWYDTVPPFCIIVLAVLALTAAIRYFRKKPVLLVLTLVIGGVISWFGGNALFELIYAGDPYAQQMLARELDERQADQNFQAQMRFVKEAFSSRERQFTLSSGTPEIHAPFAIATDPNANGFWEYSYTWKNRQQYSQYMADPSEAKTLILLRPDFSRKQYPGYERWHYVGSTQTHETPFCPILVTIIDMENKLYYPEEELCLARMRNQKEPDLSQLVYDEQFDWQEGKLDEFLARYFLRGE